MFSWEVLHHRRDSVLIGCLVPPGGVSIDWAFAWAALQKPAIWDVMRLSGLPFGEARTQAAHQCLNGNYSYLFFLDCDIVPPPDTITRLMAHRLPIVSGMYHQRFPTYAGGDLSHLPCMFNEGPGPEGKVVRAAITNFQPGQLVEAVYVPGGCLLVHRSVFERFLQEGIRQIFRWTLNVDNPQGRSEDFEFSYRAREMGIRAYVDTSVAAVHETPSRVTQKGLEPKL